MDAMTKIKIDSINKEIGLCLCNQLVILECLFYILDCGCDNTGLTDSKRALQKAITRAISQVQAHTEIVERIYQEKMP